MQQLKIFKIFAMGGLALIGMGMANSQPFVPIDTSFTTKEHFVPSSPIQSVILFQGNVDTVTNTVGKRTLAKDGNDFTGYIPIHGRSDSGYVIVNHEQNLMDSILGDGGGMSVFTAHFSRGQWRVAEDVKGRFRSVDFSQVGGTLANCGGGQTPWGTVLTAEEWEQPNNAAIYSNGMGFRDTSDFQITEFNGQNLNRSIRKYQNLNWMVEVDVANAKAVKKHYAMGRFEHEMGLSLSDGKTVYLADDATPAVFFKFISEVVGNYNKGQLYAYQQTDDGMGGSWISLPMEFDSLLSARKTALRRGATMFTRHEWIVEVGGKLYITETGRDNSKAHMQTKASVGGTVAKHLRDRMTPDSNITDYFGRILRFDPTTNKMEVFLEGGPGTTNTATHFSNPDGLTTVRVGGKDYLVIQEDLNGLTQGRVSAAAAAANRNICEMYWLDLSIANPKVDDLKRLVVGPAGSEITGARFTPDGKTMFVNLQHPDASNPAPYNTSYTMAVWGYDGNPTFLNDFQITQVGGKIQVKIDAFSRFIHFNREVNVELFDSLGKRLERFKKSKVLDVNQLHSGTYYLRFNNQEMHRIVLQ